VFLVNSRQTLVAAAPAGFDTRRGTPSPEVTGLFCRVPSRAFSRAPENLHPAYLCRFRYGHTSCPAPAFLDHPSEDFGIVSALALAGRPRPMGRSPSRWRHGAFNRHVWCRNINLPSIGYAFRPRLRSRLTLGGFTFPRKPEAFGERDSHPFNRYSFRHYHWQSVHSSLSELLHPNYHALLPLEARRTSSPTRRFGVTLSPVHYRRRAPRPVSYYALLKWWLLLSQHPGCLGGPTSFRTERDWGALAGGLGCFPLDDGAYPPPSSCRGLVHGYSEFGCEG
jgi:hypothetical protein